MINRIAFANRLVSTGLYNKPPMKGTMDALNALLDEWQGNRIYTDTRWLAYMMATVYHETGYKMYPVEEIGKGAGKPYGQKLKYGGGPNKRVPYTKPDKTYYGRGMTQNTWFEIYEKLTNANPNGWDFLNNPELLLAIKPSVWATFYGMTHGLYTGRKLADYFDSSKDDPINARKIINGLDKAEAIAVYHKRFLACLA